MNTLFIIGNGFDINLGMKTRYSDFYNYYQSLESQSKAVRSLKENISDDIENWSDLELSLGKYTENISSLNEFDEVFEDILSNLAEYLHQEESKFDYNKIDEAKILKYLCFPERSLSKADTDKIVSYKDKWHNYQWYINIMTLNYTRTVEKLLREKTQNIKIGTHHSASITLRDIQHIHGFVDDRMIMGVNDISQIKNTSFHEKQEILEAIIKTKCNKAYKHKIDDLCINQISSAKLICIFGSSIGATDNNWWELIGEQLKGECLLIIFFRGEEINQLLGYKKARKEREIRNAFLERTNLSEDEKAKVRDKIFIGINTNMFSNA